MDLDGTLVRTDTLLESALGMLTAAPWRLFPALARLRAGRAPFKAYVSEHGPIDPAALPYPDGFLTFLRAEREAGRRLVLVTAAPRATAARVAAHLGLFDEVLASDGSHNLKGAAKRDRLVARFGQGGFDYAGDARADVPVWAACREAILVNPDPGVETAARRVARVARVFADRPGGVGPYLKAMRLHHWLKNLLVFVPLIAAHQIGNLVGWGTLLTAWLAFGLTASSVYLLNDLLDLKADRAHPAKRNRPLASGNLSVIHAGLMIPVLLAAAVLVAAPLPPRFLALLGVYYLCTLAYSLRLKRVMVVDVLMLAWLYVLRVVAGTAAVGISLSFWLFAFAMFIFLSLAMVKRHAELSRFKLAGAPVPAGRGYRTDDLAILATLGTAAGYLAVLVLALYLNSPDVRALYHHPEWLWALCPLVIYWVSRLWMLAGRGDLEDDPLLFALTDRASYVGGAIGALVILYAT